MVVAETHISLHTPGLSYADDIGLLSSKHQDAQQKAGRLRKTAKAIGLNVNTSSEKVH